MVPAGKFSAVVELPGGCGQGWPGLPTQDCASPPGVGSGCVSGTHLHSMDLTPGVTRGSLSQPLHLPESRPSFKARVKFCPLLMSLWISWDFSERVLCPLKWTHPPGSYHPCDNTSGPSVVVMALFPPPEIVRWS